jgi:ribosome-associated translation inhibitor RaiA
MSTKREESKAIGHAAALREIVEERLNEIKRLVEETVSVQNAADLEVLEKRIEARVSLDTDLG